jgi:hypothetical protein
MTEITGVADRILNPVLIEGPAAIVRRLSNGLALDNTIETLMIDAVPSSTNPGVFPWPWKARCCVNQRIGEVRLADPLQPWAQALPTLFRHITLKYAILDFVDGARLAGRSAPLSPAVSAAFAGGIERLEKALLRRAMAIMNDAECSAKLAIDLRIAPKTQTIRADVGPFTAVLTESSRPGFEIVSPETWLSEMTEWFDDIEKASWMFEILPTSSAHEQLARDAWANDAT